MVYRDKIGILDTGIGGFTVVNELKKILPNEGIVYFGDNFNCPYGNKSKEEILRLTLKMLDFLDKKQVKLVGIACNTISTLIGEYKDRYEFPIFDIITPTVEHIIDSGKDNIGILGTAFTIKTQSYQNMLLGRNNAIRIVGEPSPNLAALIDSGDFDSDIVIDTVRDHLNNLTKDSPISHLVLACTHYPIVEDVFMSLSPDLKIINPAYHLAQKIKLTIEVDNMFQKDENADNTIEIYTTGKAEIYNNIAKRLKIQDKISVNIV